jgi:hypothetical protein
MTKTKKLLKELFELLDAKEETMEGRVFKIVTITSVRATDGARLGEILTSLKEISNEV